MNITYLISQIFGLVAFVISLIAYHRNKKEKIFKTMIISNILNILHYFLLGAYSGFFTKVIALIRDEIIVLKEKHKWLNSKVVLLLLYIVYLALGILTYKNIYSLFPILAAVIYLYFVWNGNELKVKKVAFFCYFLWLAYNICVFSIAGIISKSISIISTFIAVNKQKRSST